MIKRYFAHIKSKPTHHRRQHAAQVAGLFTALAFVVWVTTLGFRFSESTLTDSGSNNDADQTQLAGVASVSGSGNSTLEVVGTTSNSVYSSY